MFFMAYMVARTEKRKAGDLGGYQIHVDRKTENHGNKDIDNERSHLNYDLVGHSKETSFKEEVLDFIEENKSSKRATRKDAVVLQDWLIGSSQKFFDDLSAEETRRYFEVAVEFFQERFGKENVRFATVHMDELTPHMHLGVVPFNAENKLTAKTIFNRECLRNIQEDLPKWFQEHGFDIERGKEKSEAQHLHPEAYKKQVIQAEMEAKEQNFELVIDRILNVVEELPGAEESDFPETAEILESLTDDEGQINYGEMKNFEFYKFILAVFEEIKQFFARMSARMARRDAELNLRENTLNEKQNVLEEKIEALNEKEEKIAKIFSGIENKDVLLTVNQGKIEEINRNIRDAKMALMEWSQLEGGVNYPNQRLERIMFSYGFRDGEKWTEEEQMQYYNFQDIWEEETFEKPLPLENMPWKPQKIASYLEKEQARLAKFENVVADIGSMLTEVSKEIEETKDIKGPSMRF